MEKSKLAIAVDELLRAAAIWLLAAICIRYSIKELYLIILLATAITMLATLLLRSYYGKKNVSKQRNRQIDEAMGELLVLHRGTLLDSLAKAVDGIVEQSAVVTKNTVIYPYFYGKLPLEALNQAYNLAFTKSKKLLVLCSEHSAEIEKNLHLFSGIPVAIANKKQTYELLEKYGIVPQIQQRPKKKIHLTKAALKKSKIKGYLTAALILLITASFSPYALLCIIFAAINITLSILCEVKGN
ncbi:MAG: hypothetical protein E7350_03795 [Clostridiales bacterium]|nr:hypothetical protein [Clostridiales bacterium]